MHNVFFYDQTQYPKIAKILVAIPLIILPVMCYINRDEWLLISLFGFVFLVLALSVYYVSKSALTIQLTQEGISYTLQSFSKKESHIPLSDIQQMEVVALDYTTKFGGWGHRKNKNGEAFIFNDGTFLQVNTLNQTYYFSISDTQKESCRDLVASYILPHTKKE